MSSRAAGTRVVTRLGYRPALDQLRGAQKSGAGVPAYLRWVNRGLGRHAAALASAAGLTPNALTAASAVLSTVGLVVIAIGGHQLWGAVAGSLLLLAGYALDSADGQLARLTNSGSRSGEWLDHVVDSARLPLTHLAIAVNLYLRDAPALAIGLCLAFLVLESVWFFAQTLAEKLSTSRPLGSTAPAWVSFAKLPYDTGFLYLLVLVLPWLDVFVVVYAVLFVVTGGVALVSLRRKYTMLQREPA